MKERNLDLCYYNCGDLICDHEPCWLYNSIIRHISGDINTPATKVYEDYVKVLEEVKFTKERCNPDYELDYKGIVESLIEFFNKPNLEESYGFKDLVEIEIIK